ncbi:MAG TPA: M20/M25/M40 family metallo-hydrolase [Chloroflexota bacterium]|nr:M20/M25/M40 family metallo-hydrolase [Chloroflexota bacterium]
MATSADQASIDSRLDAHIREHLADNLAELAELVRQPSISAQNRGLNETADLVAALLRRRGLRAEIRQTGGAPVVYAESATNHDRTIIFYNHYDVQPPEPLELWSSSAFEPAERDGKLYGRGVADDKGHIVSRLAALDATRAVLGDYPCRIKFLIEGEEEIGSPNLDHFVAENRDLLAADACIWESGGVNHLGQPVLYLGMRGIASAELRVNTAQRDAHSGTGGSIFPNAAWRLVWALASIKGPDERIRLPGFYDAVVPPSERDRDLMAKAPDVARAYRDLFGLKEFLHDLSGVDLKVAAVFNPSCTINGLGSGYQGPGAKTVLPCEASAKIDFRLVPDQDPTEVIRQLREHLASEGFGDIEVHPMAGEHPARVNPDDPFVRLAVETARDLYGTDPVLEPIVGGSGPMYPFVKYLNVPIATPGIGYMDTRAHAPDENIRLDDFVRGTQHMARILARFGSMNSRL